MGWPESEAGKDFRARVHYEQALWCKYWYHGALQLLLQAWGQLGPGTLEAVKVCTAQLAVRSPHSELWILLESRDP